VNVNTITVTLSTNEAATVTDIMLKDDATGVQLGSTKSSPTGAGTYASPTGSNSFSVNFNLPANGTKVIDIYGNVKSGSNAGPWVATVDGSGTGATTGNAVTFGSSTTGQLQTITVSSAVLTTAVGVSPNNSIAIAGSSLVKVGSFNFTAQYSPYTVDKIAVKIPANAATSVTSVTLRYPNKSGVSTDSVGVISLSSGATQTYSTSTFTGLSFYIPAGTTKTLDAYVSLASIASGASSGAAVSVVLDKNEGFNATDSSGTATTTFSGGDLDSTATTGKGTVVVRQTVPTISAVALDSTVLTAGSGRTIARFKVTADAAGDVSWGKIAFKIQKTYPITLGATSTIKMYQGSNIVAGVFATTASPGSIVEPEAFPVTNASVSTTDLNLVFLPTSEQTVPAGTSLTYELRANVGNLLAANQNVLDVAIASSNYTSATTDTAANMTLTAATTPTIVWSDRSSQSIVHTGLSGSSVDWTNDYLVNTLPITVGNMTANL